jgi:hypothetical protein
VSYPAWPVGLPQTVLQDGYDETITDGSIRSKMDAGPAKARRRFTSTNEFVRCSMHITQAQWATARYFYLTTLATVLPFTWTHPSTGASANLRFVSPPRITPAGGGYVRLSLDLEVVP